ncbi:metallophosphoesterase [Propionibacteriaceae bacterium Y2011]|uniref:metallophosphoesterase n=1 Tax=Microlunatus sp. Y2014 TaxID=3418488 RepID=UPI003B46F336
MAAATDAVSIVVVADTQLMTRDHPDLFDVMTGHIIDIAAAEPVAMVLHVGDVVNDGGKDPGQYRTAARSLQRLTAHGLPLMIAPGNHDYDNELSHDRSLTQFRDAFGPLCADTASATFEPEAYENSAAIVAGPNGDLGFLTLEFGPRADVLAWAHQVLTDRADIPFIVNTHSHLYVDGQRTRPGCAHHPRLYAGTRDGHDGEEVWQRLLRHHDNVLAVFSGHHVHGNVHHRIDHTEGGSPVLQAFQNWQSEDLGGAGRFRLVTVDLVRRLVRLRVVNPVTGRFEDDEGYEVTADLARAGR